MSIPISGNYSVQPAYEPSIAQALGQQTAQPEPQTATDTVTLSQAAQVSQLSVQGDSASQISQNLGIAVSTVDLDLGVVATQVAATPSTPPAGRTHAAPVHAAPAPAATTGAPAAPVPVSVSVHA
jgi:hypothetical protein